MAFPVERWFEDEFADFGPIVRAEEVKHVMADFRRNRDAHALPLPSPCKMGAGRPLGARKAWPQGHSAWPINNEAQEASAAAAAASRAAGTEVEEEEELRRKRRQFAGGRGERVGRQEAQRGPAVFPVGKNKRGCVWGAAPDLLRMLGNQEARNMNPNGELGRRLLPPDKLANGGGWDPPRAAGERECALVLRYRREEAEIDRVVQQGNYWCDRERAAKLEPYAAVKGTALAAEGARGVGVPGHYGGHLEGGTYRQRWPYKAFPHKAAPNLA